MRKTAFLLPFLLATSVAQAFEPPPSKTLEERLAMATHVVIGAAKKVRVVEGVRDDKGNFDLKEVIPQPDTLDGLGQSVEIDIEVDEVLYPLQWQAPKTIRYLFGGGFFSVDSVRQDTVGKRLIYFMDTSYRDEINNSEDVFFPSYGWHLAESLESKPRVVELLKSRVEKQKKEEPPK